MNRMQLTTFQDDKESRSTHNEDHDTYSVLCSRTEEEKQRRRREWQRQQEREKQHEKLKQQKILEYERKVAQALKYTEQKSSYHSRSKSGSESPSHLRYRDTSISSISESGSLHEKLDEPTSGTVPLFRGPENAHINIMELRQIKVDIHRNIPVKGPITELQSDILNPEDVIVKRREGEGRKLIFDREEIKKAVIKTNEVEERRTVVAIDKEQSVSTIKLRTLRRRSLSTSPIRNHDYNSGYPLSYQSRHCMDFKHQANKTENRDTHKNDGRSSIEKRREYKEKYTERDTNKYDTNRSRSRESRNSYSRSFMEERSYRDRYRERSNERSHEKRDKDRDRDRDRNRDRNRYRSFMEERSYRDRYRERSNERSHEKRDKDRDRNRDRNRYRSFMEERSYRDRYRERSNERSHEKRDKDRDRDKDRNGDRDRERERETERDRDRNKDRNRSRERRDIAPHYIESPIPVPIYYGGFPPRPIVVSPMVPLRGQIPSIGRGRHPALMAPVRPFPPRFPPDMYRLGHPPPRIQANKYI